MRAAVLVLVGVMLLLAPTATASLCPLSFCVADDGYREGEPCQGTWWITGVWFVSPQVYVYAQGERRTCENEWSGLEGEGVRAGYDTGPLRSEARWYAYADGRCETMVEAEGFQAGGRCAAPPPALPWGELLP